MSARSHIPARTSSGSPESLKKRTAWSPVMKPRPMVSTVLKRLSYEAFSCGLISQSLPVGCGGGAGAPKGVLPRGLDCRGTFCWPLNWRGMDIDWSGRPGGGASCPRREAASYKPGGSAVGSAFMLPVRYEASMCMAMMNSVTLRAPRCSVSERFQMRPRTSLGNRAFSKISFAFSPGIC